MPVLEVVDEDLSGDDLVSPQHEKLVDGDGLLTEPDGHIATNIFDEANEQTGRYAGEKRRTSLLSDVRYRTWTHLRRGELFESLDDGTNPNATYFYDGLGRMVTEVIPGAAIERWYTYDDAARVRFVDTYEEGQTTILRRQRSSYDAASAASSRSATRRGTGRQTMAAQAAAPSCSHTPTTQRGRSSVRPAPTAPTTRALR